MPAPAVVSRTRVRAVVGRILAVAFAVSACIVPSAQAAGPVFESMAISADNMVPAKPADTASGDLLVSLIGAQCLFGGVPTITPPAGWTTLGTTTHPSIGTIRVTAYSRIADGTEGGTFTWTMAGCLFGIGGGTSGIARYSNASVATPIDATALAPSPGSANTVTVPSVTTTVPLTRLLLLAHQVTNTGLDNPAGFTQRWAGPIVGGAASVVFSDREWNTASNTGTVSVPITGGASQFGTGVLVAVRARTITVSGTARNAAGGVWSGCGVTPKVSIAVDGERAGTVACNATTGAYSLVTPANANSIVTVWYDDDAPGSDGATYTKAVDSITNITNLDVYEDEVRTLVSMTTTNLGMFDTADETGVDDIPVTAPDANTLTIGGTSTFVVAGGTFTHGTGTLTTPRLRIASGATLTPGGGHQLVLNGSGTGACTTGTSARPLCVSGTITIPLNARYTGTSALEVDGTTPYASLQLQPTAGSPTYQLGSLDDASITASSLTIGGGAGAVIASTSTYSPSATVTGAVTVNANGTLGGNGSGTITSNGSLEGGGSVLLTGGTYQLRTSAMSGRVIDASGAGASWLFSTLHLTTTVAPGASIGSPITSRGLTIAVRLVLGDAGDPGVTAFDDASPLNILGDFETTVNGALLAPSSFTIEGDIIHRGNFDPRGGMMTFAGTGTSTLTTYTGSTGSLYDLRVATPGKTLALDTDSGMQIDHLLDLQGTDCGNVVGLVSANPGSPQTLVVLGSISADWASFADIAATSPLAVDHSGDLGGNTNIDFDVEPPCSGPLNLFTDTDDASIGSTRPTTVDGRGPFHMSFENNSQGTVDRYRTGISSSWISGDTIGLWPLDGSGADRTATANPMANAHGPGTDPTWVAGATDFGQAADFDGVDDILAAPSDPAYDVTNFTIEAWIRTTTIANSAVPVVAIRAQTGQLGQFALYFDQAAGELRGSVTAGGSVFTVATPAAPWLDDTWHHLALTADPSKDLRLYVDGVQYGSTVPYTGTIDLVSEPVAIGNTGTPSTAFDGMIDDVQFTARALSQAELAGYAATQRPHAQVVWQTTAPTGDALDSPCAPGDRCDDVTYGGTDLHRTGARWFVAHQTRTTDGLWSNFSFDWFETNDGISISPITPIGLPGRAPGDDATDSTTVTTTCTVGSGCTLFVQSPSQTVGMHTTDNGGGTVPHITPASPSAPGPWPANDPRGIGFTVLDTTSGKDDGVWGPGTDFTDLDDLAFVGVTRTPVALVSTSAAGTETTTVGVRMNASPGTTTGDYSGSFMAIAVGNL